MEKFLSDDPEARQAFVDRKAISEARRQVAKEKAEAERKLYDAEMLVWASKMKEKASELSRETGIPIDDLEGCNTEEEMEVKALRYEKLHSKPVESPKPPATPTPRADSGISTTVGGKLTHEMIEEMSTEAYADHPSVKERYK
jgi:hypothetical protein